MPERSMWNKKFIGDFRGGGVGVSALSAILDQDEAKVGHDTQVNDEYGDFRPGNPPDDFKDLDRDIHAAGQDGKPLRPGFPQPEPYGFDHAHDRVHGCGHCQAPEPGVGNPFRQVKKDARVMAGMVEMNTQVQMIINSPGGSCPTGFSIIDIMEWSPIRIYTTDIGMIASMGLLIFMTGEKGRRVITPRTFILSHRFTAFNFGNHSQLIASRKEEDLEHERIHQHYLSCSNIKQKDELEKYLLRDVDTWLTPDEAIQFGLADIVEPLRKRG